MNAAFNNVEELYLKARYLHDIRGKKLRELGYATDIILQEDEDDIREINMEWLREKHAEYVEALTAYENAYREWDNARGRCVKP